VVAPAIPRGTLSPQQHHPAIVMSRGTVPYSTLLKVQMNSGIGGRRRISRREGRAIGIQMRYDILIVAMGRKITRQS